MVPIDASADCVPRSPGQPIKRAPVVYGRRSEHHPPPANEQVQPFDCDRAHYAPAMPSQRSASSPPPSSSIHASYSDPFHSSSLIDTFQFGFRHRLKELDEQFDSHDAQSPKPGSSLSSQVVRAGPSQVKDLQSVSKGTVVLFSEACHSSRGPHAVLSPSPTSSRATSVQEHPPESPPVRRRTRRVQIPSDSEAEEPGNSSSVSPVRHAITTPHSRSSPTPPTSGEIPMVSRKAMGKAPARDVLPLLFDVEQPSASEFPAKVKKRRRSQTLVRPKTKAPTKKERREAAFESCRIAANRSVEVLRTQEQKHSLAAFFSGLRRDNIVTSTPGTELPSDPIEGFSSPTNNSTLVPPPSSMFGAPTGLLAVSAPVGTVNQSSPSENTKALLPMTGDSDDEIPSVTSIVQHANEKQQRLQAIKQVALQHASTSKAFDIDSEDDDLLIVKDDMHAVAREEAAQRRLDKAHSTPSKDVISSRKINHPSVRPAVISHRLSKQELQELAKPSFARMGKGARDQVSKEELDQLMLMQHKQEQLKSIQWNEEKWIQGGGKLLRDASGDHARISLSQRLGAYAEQGLKALETGNEDEDEDGTSADENDEDYTPDLQCSADPKFMNGDENGGEPGDNMEISQVSQPPVYDDHDDGDEVVLLRRNKSGPRNPRIVVGSDDEGEQLIRHDSPTQQRDSTSSLESQTEDENDKENSAKLMYDRSEDKENKAVVRHKLSSSELAPGLRLGSSQSIDESLPRNLSLPSATDLNDTTESPKENARSPLKEISKDEDDLFLSPSLSNSAPFTERLLHGAAMSPPLTTTLPLTLESPPVLRSGPISRINRLSLDSENDENDPPGFKLLQSSFLERLRSQVGPEAPLTSISPISNDGFSQLFTAEDGSLKQPISGLENDGLSLTLDVGLRPALEVSGTLRQRAEVIFQKEQEYVVAAAIQQSDRPKQPLYVNDHGFLTQTRPEGSSPDHVYHITSSPASKLIGTQIHFTQTQPPSVRPPLRTLSFTASQEPSPEPQPLRRLRKRSSSPLGQKNPEQSNNSVTQLNVFGILGKASGLLSKAEKGDFEKSEFVAVEAEESDEDDMFGFGGPKKEEEEEDNDQDKVVEGLVDDTVMDAETEAADLVQEKYREHEEKDDQQLQKLHQDAIEGKFRMKRRDRGVGFEDDSDEEDDDDARRIRQRIHKKRRIEGDSLEALGQNEETRAFYNMYHQDLVDEDDFGNLQDVAMPASTNDDAAEAEELEEQETLSVDEIRQRVREVAQRKIEVEVLDPEDTSWIDQSMVVEADDAVRVKVVEHRRSKSTACQPSVDQMDFDPEHSKRQVESEQERKQLMFWAKNQSHGRQGTGRSGNSAAVTGHTKARRIEGNSLRSMQSNPPNASKPHKTRTPNLLSAVSHRKGKFA